MDTEKFQSKGKRIMSKTRFTEFRVLSVDPKVGISRSVLEIDGGLFSLSMILKINIIYHS